MQKPRSPLAALDAAAFGGAAVLARLSLAHALPAAIPRVREARPWLAVRELGLMFRRADAAERALAMLRPHDPAARLDGLTVRARVPFALAAVVSVAAGRFGSVTELVAGQGTTPTGQTPLGTPGRARR